MPKHYYKDTMTGRVAVADPKQHFDQDAFIARQAENNRQQDQINARAERLAIAAGFTRTEYRNARSSTRLRWQTRALDALISDGHTFSAVIDGFNRPA